MIHVCLCRLYPTVKSGLSTVNRTPKINIGAIKLLNRYH
jgi:hypothetical protein